MALIEHFYYVFLITQPWKNIINQSYFSGNFMIILYNISQYGFILTILITFFLTFTLVIFKTILININQDVEF